MAKSSRRLTRDRTLSISGAKRGEPQGRSASRTIVCRIRRQQAVAGGLKVFGNGHAGSVTWRSSKLRKIASQELVGLGSLRRSSAADDSGDRSSRKIHLRCMAIA